MTTLTMPKLIALTLAAAISATWFSTIITGMQSPSAPTQYSIELPTIVIVGHKAPASDTTAQTKPSTGNNT